MIVYFLTSAKYMFTKMDILFSVVDGVLFYFILNVDVAFTTIAFFSSFGKFYRHL